MTWFHSGQQTWFSSQNIKRWPEEGRGEGPSVLIVHGPPLLKWKQKLFHLKQKGSPAYYTFAGNEVNQVRVSSLIFPLPHSHPKTCSHDSDIQTERTAEQE